MPCPARTSLSALRRLMGRDAVVAAYQIRLISRTYSESRASAPISRMKGTNRFNFMSKAVAGLSVEW